MRQIITALFFCLAAALTLQSRAELTVSGVNIVSSGSGTNGSLSVAGTVSAVNSAQSGGGGWVVCNLEQELLLDSATNILVIGPAAGDVVLGNLSQVYDGMAKLVTVATSPTNLNVSVTYNGNPNAPTNAGSYTVVGTINDANYSGSATNTLVVTKANATVNLAGLSQSYTGNGCPATATTTPAGLSVSLTYNGNPNAPTNAGSYTVVGTINDANYSGSATNTLVITKLMIINQPQGCVLATGANTNLAVAAIGSGTLKYQWRKNSVSVSGKTNAVLTLASVTTNNTGNYTVVITNSYGAVTSSVATVTVIAPPVLAIQTPTANQRWSNIVMNASGTVKANYALSGVYYNLNNTGWTNANSNNGYTNWNAALLLQPGTNVLAVYAMDGIGNNSATSIVTFVCSLMTPLNVSMIGKGAILPNYSNALLQIGTKYTVTATPAKGFAFVNWQTNGTLATNKNALTFVMASNLTLLATTQETNRPTLTVTTPVNNAKLGSNTVAMIGKASDVWLVTNVSYAVNGGQWTNASSTSSYTNWTASVSLSARTNTLLVYAQNLGGVYSLTNKLTVINTNSFALNLRINFATESKTMKLANTKTMSKGVVLNVELADETKGHIEYSTDLIHWTTLTNFAGTNQLMQFDDPASTTEPKRFYRVVTP